MLYKNNPGFRNERRIKALDRLEHPKNSLKEESNKTRVKKEIEILKSRIITSAEARGIRTKKERTSNDKNT